MKKILTFLGEVKGELYKVTWPWTSEVNTSGIAKYKKLFNSSIVVLVAMLFLAAYVLVWDLIQQKTVQYLINLFQ